MNMLHTADEIKDWFLAWTYDDKSTRITKTKIQKLLYYAQGHSCAILGRPIFSDEIQAYEYGPVVVEVLEQLQSAFADRESLVLDKKFDFAWFTAEENQLLADVWETYGSYSSEELSEMSHESPWEAAWANGRETLIPLEDIEQFFIEQNYFHFMKSNEGASLETSLMNA